VPAALEWRIPTALPFLVLGPLARIGWLDMLAVSLECEGAGELMPLAGALLAHKVLPAPGRGWSRDPADARAVAAACLLPEPPEGASLHSFARACRDHLPGLDAAVADSLCTGHRAGAPLLLTQTAAGLLLADSDGAFPITCAAEVGALGPVLRLLPRELVLVPAQTATRHVLAGLDALGARFATDAPAGRGERWRMLPPRERGEPDLWTNDDAIEAGPLHAALSGAALAGAAWREIAARPALPGGRDPALEISFGLAASLALGSIAWELWRAREPAAPDLALDRFADFDAVVRAEPETVTVVLPLGRRFFDLRAHGFLDDVGGVPWFGDRPLCFRSG
jgi:hypothetical protein